MPKVKLIGLVEPVSEASREAFEEWYLGNHIEDVSHTPGIIRATAHRLVKPFMKTDPPQYITIYEFDTDSMEAAEKALSDYLAAPTWPGSKPANNSLKIVSAGWYEVDRSFSS
ncbi:MAG: EthD domain-containing protein [Desulfobacterales bacterium]